ncbi:F-box/kelch-repeat protein At3g23880-like [Silene latifolia]|uniref:F-box/kelch-repeat protein At3g23880-like n=1 Tax=Silene latifolia TaxID=37657 RepID=UPI003D775DE2
MTKSKKKHVIPQQSYLSDDLIIEEILTRLPVKSIIRFKSVSKQWYSTVSSSEFANAQLIKSPFPHPSAPIDTLFIKCGKNCYLFSCDDDEQICANSEDNLVKLDVDFGVGKYNLELTGCCNGLICLTQYYNEYFILLNPATRKLHQYESDGYLKRFDESKCPYVASGFGYASNVDDYKYVRILSEYGGNEKKPIVHIFSLRENRWREIDFDHNPLVVYRNAMLVNDKLYWHAVSIQDGDSVVSFDLGTERFDIITINCAEQDALGVMGGRLSTCSCTGDKLMNILEPPSILKSICLPKGFRLDMYSQMLGFTKADNFFVTNPLYDEGSGGATLGLLDTRTKPMQYTTLLRFDMLLKIAIYFPSLVSPFPIVEPLEA